MKFSEFEKIKKYSDGNGSISYLEPRIKMKLNKNGLFEEYNDTDEDFILNTQSLKAVMNFNINENVSTIADELYKNNPEIYFDNRIGYYKSLYVGYVKEAAYRRNGSSGGMGTWIFKELLEKKLIDGVIHVKKSKNRNLLFEYGISKTLEEVLEGAKTKYYPVEMSQVLKLVKEVPGRYAIVGIPSFINSIRLLQKIDPIIKERIVFTVGLICGHIKSSLFAESLGWQLGFKPGNIEEIDFRKKHENYPANRYGVEITGVIDGNKKTENKMMKDLVGGNWGMGYFKSFASDFTDDVFNETADITLGDAWLPEYTADSKGNNVVIVRNSEIDELIKDSIRDEKIKMDKVSLETIFRSQSSHYRHTYEEAAYRLYLGGKQNSWVPKLRVNASSDFTFIRKKIQRMRMDISESSFKVFNEAKESENINIYLEGMKSKSKKYITLYRILNFKNNRYMRKLKSIFVSE